MVGCNVPSKAVLLQQPHASTVHHNAQAVMLSHSTSSCTTGGIFAALLPQHMPHGAQIVQHCCAQLFSRMHASCRKTIDSTLQRSCHNNSSMPPSSCRLQRSHQPVHAAVTARQHSAAALVPFDWEQERRQGSGAQSKMPNWRPQLMSRNPFAAAARCS